MDMVADQEEVGEGIGASPVTTCTGQLALISNVYQFPAPVLTITTASWSPKAGKSRFSMARPVPVLAQALGLAAAVTIMMATAGEEVAVAGKTHFPPKSIQQQDINNEARCYYNEIIQLHTGYF